MTKPCKPLIKIFGGKQMLAKKLSSLVTEHLTYVEPFCGGSALFFYRDVTAINTILNDLHKNIATTYRIAKKYPEELYLELDSRLYSRDEYKKAVEIFNNPDNYTELEVAWATIFGYAASYGYIMGGSYNSRPFVNNGGAYKVVSIYRNYVEKIRESMEKLKYANIENLDAVKCIERFDTKDTFFYCDPPYIGTTSTNFPSFSEGNYQELLKCLSKIKGKFLLSSYKGPQLEEFINTYGFNVQKVKKEGRLKTMGNKKKSSVYTEEIMVYNYEL